MAIKLRDRANVGFGAPNVKVSGGCLIGNVATDKEKYPADATATLDTSLGAVSGGYISKEGLTQTIDQQTQKFEDWNLDLVANAQTAHNVSFKLTFLEYANGEVAKFIFGEDNVTISGGKMSIDVKAGDPPHRSLTFDMITGKDTKVRIFVPEGAVSTIGDVKYAKDSLIQYDLTIDCFPDEDGLKFKMLRDAPSGEA